MASRRENILARLAVIIANLPGIETADRNNDRASDSKLPAAVLFDGDEQSFENLRATGLAPNVIDMTPTVVVSLGDVPENVGTVTNEWLALVQKAVLGDLIIDELAGGKMQTNGRRIPNGGARFVGATTSLQEG